ncbi:MAG: mannonate dehydratase [Proteobacteria bacterium]|nr:mannonate dehydratase [Pseudomonadota bacterium]
MEQTWRWFGPDDVVTLHDARQAGATGIVTALHHIPYGVIWSVEEIEKRKAEIAAPGLGLRWSVVESLPVHERVKLGEGDLEPIFDAYRQSLRNLAACGIRTVCYNFMPVLDWTRTQLDYVTASGARALRFNLHEYVAFDWLLLERPGATDGISEDVLRRARAWFDTSTEADRTRLIANINAGLPGAYDRYDISGFRRLLDRYKGMDATTLRGNLARFLKAVVPTAEEVGVNLCIHPDDPPRPLFGLARVVSTGDDLATILAMVDSPANGITLCSGSLGAHPTNDVPAIARAVAHRIWFAHLRNVARDPDGSFMEADHLGGDTDMVALIEVLLTEERRRKAAGAAHWQIPLRPDHGHEMLDDIGKGAFPGYSAIGRLRGLAEIRGVMAALSHGHRPG